jgi:hypothetical protein
MTYDLHPLCVLFPRMAGAEFAALVDDIKANGLRTPIVLHNDMVLDGGNRYAACLKAGVDPTFTEFGGGNLVSFVLSANMHRRHMSPGQQAAIVASAQDWAKAQPRGGDRKSDQSATLHLDRVQDRAAQSGASERTQKMADKVAKADPALAVKVAHGEVSLPKAHAAVSAPPAVKPAPAAAPTAPTNDAHDDFDPIAELERLQTELIATQALVTAAEATDLKAEAIKWRRIADQAQRRQAELMQTVADREKDLQRQHRILQRIGKAAGEMDPGKLAPVVEAFYRANSKVAA